MKPKRLPLTHPLTKFLLPAVETVTRAYRNSRPLPICSPVTTSYSKKFRPLYRRQPRQAVVAHELFASGKPISRNTLVSG
jgi:hypothetical protein